MEEFSKQLDDLIAKLVKVQEEANKAKFAPGALHGHKYQRLNDEAIYCECGSILFATKPAYNPTPWQPYQPYWGTSWTIGDSTTTLTLNPNTQPGQQYGASGEPI